MSVREYIGARYVPVFADPIQWDPTLVYEPLTVVTDQGASYVSRRMVPEGIQLDNTDYWVLWADFNAQLQHYIDEVETFDGRIDAVEEALPVESFTSQSTVSDAISELETMISNRTYVNVKDFGAIGDGTTDDTEAIQAAIDSLKDVYFPTNNNETYKVTATLHTGREGQSFFCDPYSNTGIMFHINDQVTPLFSVDHELIRFINIHLRSHTRDTGIAIQAEAPNAYVDGVFTNNTDVTIMDSDISNFYKGIVTNARGPRIADTTFAVLTTAIEVYWNNQSSSIGTDVGQVLYGNDYGMRGIQILDCRFHVISSNCILFDSGNPTGAIIDSNRYDVGTGYFLRTSSGVVMKNCIVSNNTIQYANVQSIRFEDDIQDTIIDGNVFLGFPPKPNMGTRTTQGIVIRCVNVSRCAITSNNFSYCGEDAIRIETVSNTTISGNTFYNIGLGAESGNIRGCVFVNTAANGLVFSNNAGTFAHPEYSALVHSRAVVSISRSFITGNAIVSASAINSYTDGGQNEVQTALTA